LATPLASSAASFDVTKVADVAAKIVKVVATADSAFQTHRGLSQHNHGQGSGAVNGIGNPGPSTPEPTAALLFGLGAVVVGAGIRRRR
jgi:hypothetical protein